MSLSARLPTGRPTIVAAATVLAALALVAGLAFWGAAIAGQAEALDEQQARLDVLMARPLPAPAMRIETAPGDEADMRMLAASGPGAAASLLQNALSDAGAAAGLTIARLGTEPATGDDAEHEVVVRIEGSGSMDALQAFLFHVETGFPYFFVDMLDVEHGNDPADDALAITVTIRAGWKAPAS